MPRGGNVKSRETQKMNNSFCRCSETKPRAVYDNAACLGGLGCATRRRATTSDGLKKQKDH